MSGGDVEKQVYSAESEQRNVAQTIQAALKTGVTAEPVFAMKTKAERKPGKKAEQDPEPSDDQVEMERIHFKHGT